MDHIQVLEQLSEEWFDHAWEAGMDSEKYAARLAVSGIFFDQAWIAYNQRYRNRLIREGKAVVVSN